MWGHALSCDCLVCRALVFTLREISSNSGVPGFLEYAAERLRGLEVDFREEGHRLARESQGKFVGTPNFTPIPPLPPPLFAASRGGFPNPCNFPGTVEPGPAPLPKAAERESEPPPKEAESQGRLRLSAKAKPAEPPQGTKVVTKAEPSEESANKEPLVELPESKAKEKEKKRRKRSQEGREPLPSPSPRKRKRKEKSRRKERNPSRSPSQEEAKPSSWRGDRSPRGKERKTRYEGEQIVTSWTPSRSPAYREQRERERQEVGSPRNREGAEAPRSRSLSRRHRPRTPDHPPPRPGRGGRQGRGWIGHIPRSGHARWHKGKNKGVVKRAKQERYNRHRWGWHQNEGWWGRLLLRLLSGGLQRQWCEWPGRRNFAKKSQGTWKG